MANESKKETFRKYLESSGVVDSLTKVLVALYEEPSKPPQAVDYMKTQLGSPTPAEYDIVVAERDALAAKVAELELKVAELTAAAAPPPVEGEAPPA